MLRYASATYAAAFGADCDPSTVAYLEMLDTMRTEAAATEEDPAAPTRCTRLFRYGVALVPLCHAIGDVFTPGDERNCCTVPASEPLLFAGYEPAPGVDANWAMTVFSSDRVVNEALMALCAALQCCVADAQAVWNYLEPRVGVGREAADPALAAATGGLGIQSAVVAMRTAQQTAATAAARVAAVDAAIATVDGIVETLCHLLRCDARQCGVAAAASAAETPQDASGTGGSAASTPSDSNRALKATVLAMALYATELSRATRALCDLHEGCATVWLSAKTHACAPEVRAESVRAALRATRGHWLRAAFGCIRLFQQASQPDAPVPLRALYGALATWADSCRRVHFRAASVYFASYCDWSAVIWTRACALQANPDPQASAGPVHTALTQRATGEASALEDGFTANDAMVIRTLCPGACGGGGPNADLPWFPDGVARDEYAADPLMVHAITRRFTQQTDGGRAASVLYPHATTIYNWHMPLVYFAMCREPYVETQPIEALLVRTNASREIAAAARQSVRLVFPVAPIAPL